MRYAGLTTRVDPFVVSLPASTAPTTVGARATEVGCAPGIAAATGTPAEQSVPLVSRRKILYLQLYFTNTVTTEYCIYSYIYSCTVLVSTAVFY